MVSKKFRNGCVRQEEEENELVKDFVGAMYNDDKMIPKTMLREPPHISKGDIAKKLNTAKGCLDQVGADTAVSTYAEATSAFPLLVFVSWC
jgi:hypothetical protein